jgi:hypothetical protein
VAQCPSQQHNLKYMRALQALIPKHTLTHNWTVATYSLCLPEYHELLGHKGNFVPDAKDN